MPTQVLRILSVLLMLTGLARGQNLHAIVGFEEPQRQFLQVELQLSGFDGAVELVMPVWTPGSYKVRDYSQYVEAFEVVDARSAAVPFRKLTKNRWELSRADDVTVRYRYFAAETSVRHCYLDSTQAFLMPGSLLPYVDGFLAHPYQIELRLPPGWYADTSLEEVRPGVYHASNYDRLVDCPIQVGTHERHDFEVDGTRFRMTLTGDSNMDTSAMVQDIRKVVIANGAMFDGFPFDRYLFLVRVGGGGGLEHADSTALMTGAYRFDSKSGWESFLGLVAHEFFHAWNVKRIRDEVLGPFDYTKEVYTRLLWMHEGWTSYYGPVLLRRAGITQDSDLMRSYERTLNNYKRRPGRLVQGLAQSSFDSWIKFYQTTATSHNSTVDYYSHGRVAALCLDLILRKHSNNEHGLDEVMSRLWTEFGIPDRGFNEQDLRSILVEFGGPEAEEFWDRYVIAPGDIDLGRYLAYAGLEWTSRHADKPADATGKEATEGKGSASDKKGRSTGKEDGAAKPRDGATRAQDDASAGRAETADSNDEPWEPWKHADPPHLGFTTGLVGSTLVVRSVERDGTAWQDGLAIGDELIAVGDRRITDSAWTPMLREAMEHGVIELTISRAGRLQPLSLRLEGVRSEFKLTKAKKADALAQEIYRSLFDAPFRKDEGKSKDDGKAGDAGAKGGR